MQILKQQATLKGVDVNDEILTLIGDAGAERHPEDDRRLAQRSGVRRTGGQGNYVRDGERDPEPPHD